MAARNTAPATFSFDAIKPEVSDIEIGSNREAKYNPWLTYVTEANQVENHGKWYKVGPVPEAHKKEAYNLLRRAQKTLKCGLSIREEDHGNGTYTYHYAAGLPKNTDYTAADVREWATRNNVTIPAKGKLPISARNAYREAHGLKTLKR